MSDALPVIYLARHGETEWSLSGQHTGLTDLPLTDRGQRNARRLGERLRGMTFGKVLASPLQRAARTCELAGFSAVAEVDRDLLEWNYGEYEGRRTAEIRAESSDWQLFRDGCPGGEIPAQVGARADCVAKRVRAIQGDVLLFSSGHFLREPHNLGPGWVGFDFRRGFGRPVTIVNDAAMQAVGSYKRGKMLFLGLGTGLGSTLIVDGIVEPMELAHLPYKQARYEDYVGLRGFKRLGKKKWGRHVAEVVAELTAALEPNDVVLGGGHVKELEELPKGGRAGDNANAFIGVFQLLKQGKGGLK